MTSPVPTAVSVVRDAFLESVRTAELLTPSQLARAEAAVSPDVATSNEAARALVAAGYLTKFQAERLLAGRTDGFHLGPYIIQEQVGRGAMGRVYKARHRTMNRSVAIKVLSTEFTRTVADRQALQREVRAAAQFNHPNIVTAYDANELADRHYLVLEFVDGPNLETLVRERGPLPVAEACELARQAALGLAHAHSLGMIHRDIKPGNLLVARASTHPGYVVKIADFGIAKLAQAQTPTPGKCVGNPDFIAPEQARDLRTTDHRADLYSLGAVLYFMLSGRPVFFGGTAEQKVCRHLLEEPVRIDRLRADIHPALAALVHQLLAKHPQSRPSSATEVAERLEGSFGAVGNGINFELPPPNAGPHSFISGHLSGRYPTGTTEQALENSGRHSGPYARTNPATDTSPWEQITGSNLAIDTNTPVLISLPRKRSRFSMWKASGVFAGVLLMSLAAIGVVFKMVTK
ncbi:MAG TPA: serine/threonine-protein kinase [Gemmata sp.]|jgi:serine/threonine-protein kinase|nr:serine/threonine-protein kinase [Gemmata sp.]